MLAYYDILSAKSWSYSVIIDVLIYFKYWSPIGNFFISYNLLSYDDEVGNYSYSSAILDYNYIIFSFLDWGRYEPPSFLLPFSFLFLLNLFYFLSRSKLDSSFESDISLFFSSSLGESLAKDPVNSKLVFLFNNFLSPSVALVALVTLVLLDSILADFFCLFLCCLSWKMFVLIG